MVQIHRPVAAVERAGAVLPQPVNLLVRRKVKREIEFEAGQLVGAGVAQLIGGGAVGGVMRHCDGGIPQLHAPVAEAGQLLAVTQKPHRKGGLFDLDRGGAGRKGKICALLLHRERNVRCRGGHHIAGRVGKLLFGIGQPQNIAAERLYPQPGAVIGLDDNAVRRAGVAGQFHKKASLSAHKRCNNPC